MASTPARSQAGSCEGPAGSTDRYWDALTDCPVARERSPAVVATSYAALTAALSQNSWKPVTLPSRSVNTIAKSESKFRFADVVAV
jgi:hypothetical protein